MKMFENCMNHYSIEVINQIQCLPLSLCFQVSLDGVDFNNY